MAGKKTPELQLLTEQDWLNEVAERELDTEDACRQSMSHLRNTAKNRFGNAVNKALEGFAQANNQQLPTEPSQLAPYLAPPADSFLDGYEIAKPGWVHPPRPNSPLAERARIWAMVEKSTFTPEGKAIRDGSQLADPDHDYYCVIYQGGATATASAGRRNNLPLGLRPGREFIAMSGFCGGGYRAAHGCGSHLAEDAAPNTGKWFQGPPAFRR